MTVDFDFRQSTAPWQAVFADYRAELAADFEFRSGYAPIPPNLAPRSGFLLSAANRSDDVFMGIYRLVDGLRPNTRYRVDVELTFASSAASTCAGVGGAPSSVYVKAGASRVVPEPERTGYVTLPLDKGNQSVGGRDMVVIGDVGISENTACGPPDPYKTKTLRTGAISPAVESDAQGRLWVIAGTDSAFEGTTSIYVLEGRFTLAPQ